MDQALDFSHVCVYNNSQMKWFAAKGPVAAGIRQRKDELVRRCGMPENALPGSLALTHRKCGNANYRCATGQGHPLWSLTFMGEGKKRVESLPAAWVDDIRPPVGEGREYKGAVAEVCAINAQLLALWRQQQTKKRKTR